MVNGVFVQFAVFSLAAVILICMVIVLKRRKKQPEPFRIAPPIRPVLEKSQTIQSKPTQIAASRNERNETRKYTCARTEDNAITGEFRGPKANSGHRCTGDVDDSGRQKPTNPRGHLGKHPEESSK